MRKAKELELQKFHDREGAEYSAGPERVYERVDYGAKASMLLARIESMEKSRAVLLAEIERAAKATHDDDDEPPQWVISVVGPKGKPIL